MPLFFDNNATIQNVNNIALLINQNSKTGLTFSVGGYGSIPGEPFRPYFVVQSTLGTTTFSSTYVTPFNYSLINNGSHFNTSTYRFTAPTDGRYYFTGHHYIQKSSPVTAAQALRPFFRVNGSLTQRQSTFSEPWRIRGKNNSTSTTVLDTQMSEILFLYQGDYVEFVLVPITSSFVLFPFYSIFSGYFLG